MIFPARARYLCLARSAVTGALVDTYPIAGLSSGLLAPAPNETCGFRYTVYLAYSPIFSSDGDPNRWHVKYTMDTTTVLTSPVAAVPRFCYLPMFWFPSGERIQYSMGTTSLVVVGNVTMTLREHTGTGSATTSTIIGTAVAQTPTIAPSPNLYGGSWISMFLQLVGTGAVSATVTRLIIELSINTHPR